uniref:BRCA1-associated RING domain protein 1 n=1 Tax=Pelusios castaneus TaxID=367368 RepID=A0A8C8SYP4_9SAUR
MTCVYICLTFRACVGDSIGTECPVCHTPAWAQDVQINRQLDNMVQLCSKLRHLLGKDFTDSAEDLFTSIDSEHETRSKKRQIKMWFSPRSRKIRCVLNNSSFQKQNQLVTDSGSIQQGPSSTFDFVPSPPQEKPSKTIKQPPRRSKKKLKKKSLVDINQVWGIEKEKQKKGSGAEEETQDEFKEKTVTFCSQPLVICSPEPNSIEEVTGQEFVTETYGKNGSESHLEMAIEVKSTENKDNSKVTCFAQVNTMNDFNTEKSLPSENETTPLKRGRQQSLLPAITHSKRLRRSGRSADTHSVSPGVGSLQLPQDCTVKISPATERGSPVQISTPASKLTGVTLSETRSSAIFQEINSPSCPKTPSTPFTSNTHNYMETTHSPSLLKKSPGGNTATKRNHRGETLLHVASIKGDVSAVECLLKNGADPNVKDHAGWTPLHEACNQGHEKVVELLLQHRALVNTTGYQNDSPLHDAAKNGHVSIVELLLSHGASRDAVNIFGLRPVDYAETEKMKSVLMVPMKNESYSFSQSSPSHPREGPVVLLGNSLNSEQQKSLNKLTAVLKARKCIEFNSTVTHFIVPNDPVRSTIKCMLAILTGCWVLKYEWVKACLQSGVREQEENYEICGGPRRGRLNQEQLLPKLFDGCYFYFLGTFNHHQKDELMELVKAAGGKILIRQPKPDSDVTQTINTVAYHAEPGSDQSFCTQYVIYDVSSKYKPDKIRQGKVWTAPSSWLIDSVMSFQLLPVTK